MNPPISDRIAKTAPYPFAEIDKKVAELKEQGMEVIDFGVGDPSSPTPDFVIDALHEGAKKHATSGYPSYIGSGDYRSACSAYMQKNFGVELDPETEVSSTVGSKEAVFHFPLAYINPGDTVICPTPGYTPYKTGTEYAGGESFFVPLLEENNYLIDYEAIPEEVCKKTKIIWTNYPNSPTGACAPREWLEGLVAWAKSNDIIIAADEGCYHDLYFQEKPTSILEVTKEGVIAIYSLSKRNNMTGYRVGFVAGDQEIVSAFKKVKTNIDSGTPNFVQEAAIAALQNDDHVASMLEQYRTKKDMLTSALQGAGLPESDSDATFFLWQRAPEGMTGVELANRFVDLGIVVIPGAWISDTTAEGINPGEHYVRFALMPTMEQMEEACSRIAELSL